MEEHSFYEYGIAQLVVAKMLIPLGKPAHNSPKHFATVDIIKVAQNREWLSIATRQISRYWQSRNEKKRVINIFTVLSEGGFY